MIILHLQRIHEAVFKDQPRYQEKIYIYIWIISIFTILEYYLCQFSAPFSKPSTIIYRTPWIPWIPWMPWQAIYEMFLLEPQFSRVFLNRLLGRINEAGRVWDGWDESPLPSWGRIDVIERDTCRSFIHICIYIHVYMVICMCVWHCVRINICCKYIYIYICNYIRSSCCQSLVHTEPQDKNGVQYFGPHA